jgi:hypothetical protein
MGDSERLTPKKRAFVRALLTERDTRAAARAVGIGETTAYRWMKLGAIRAAILDAEVDALAATTRGLLRLSGEAVNTLDDAMGDGDAPTGARIRAADVVLARLLQLRELVTLEERVTRLEEVLGDIE